MPPAAPEIPGVAGGLLFAATFSIYDLRLTRLKLVRT
jgi:hypothetical protein